MNNDPVVIDASEAVSKINVTVYVRWSRRFKFRYWLGFRVIAIGARVIGLGLTRLETE